MPSRSDAARRWASTPSPSGASSADPGGLVGEGGFEPPTSCSQSRCATTAPLPVTGCRVAPDGPSRNACRAVRTPTGTLALRMKSTVEPLEGNKVKLSVEVDASEFEPAVDAAFKKIAREVRLPGFRPGKAPRKVLEARLGPLAGREQALHDSLPEYYSAAVIEHDVDVIAAPEIDITGGQETGDIAFDAVVEVRPSIKVPGYERAERHARAPRRRRGRPRCPDRPHARPRQHARGRGAAHRRRATRSRSTSPARSTARRSRASPPTTTATPVGSGAITPEVDEQLVGAEAGAALSFAATHPDPDEDRELQFELTVKEVKEKVLPELTDEWASEASEFETVAELPSEPGRPDDARPQGAGADGAAGEGRRGAGRARHRRGARADDRPGDAGAPARPRHAAPGPGHAARAVPRHDRGRSGDLQPGAPRHRRRRP